MKRNLLTACKHCGFTKGVHRGSDYRCPNPDKRDSNDPYNGSSTKFEEAKGVGNVKKA